jgi:transcriptional regulator with XRE-family HTH domain
MTEGWPLFALKLRQMRRARGLSQKELAKRSGVGPKTISSFETGQRTSTISLDQLFDLTWACGINPADIINDFYAARKAGQTGARIRRRHYRKQAQKPVLQYAKPRPVTLFRSSDFLVSSLGDPRR